MELRDYVRILRRRWRSIVVLAVLGALVGLSVALASAKVYAAQSKVYVKVPSSNSSTAYNALQYVLGQMPSYAQLDGSPEVLRPVIKQLGLSESVQSLAAEVTITNPTGTVYLDVDAQASSKAKAVRLANAAGSQLATVIERLGTSQNTAARVVVADPQPATTSDTPVSPRPSLDIALGFVTGLVLGMILALVRNRLDTSVRDADELHRLTGFAPLAVVPAGADRPEPAVVDRRGPQVAAARAARTNLALISGGHLPPSVAVIAADTEDGAFLAVDLAHVAARAGISTCLVETDLRRPRLADALSSAPLIGLSAVLEGDADLADAVFAWPSAPDGAGSAGSADPDVRPAAPAVVVAGRAADDPADLLDSARMQRLHRRLAATFDLVVYLCPPARAGSDAVIVARDAAAAVVVVRAGVTSRADLAAAAESMDSVGARVAGAVLVESGRGRRARRRGAAKARRSSNASVPLSADPLTPVPLVEPFTPDPAARTAFERPVPPAPTGSPRRTLPQGPMPPRARSSSTRRAALRATIDDAESMAPMESSQA